MAVQVITLSKERFQATERIFNAPKQEESMLLLLLIRRLLLPLGVVGWFVVDVLTPETGLQEVIYSSIKKCDSEIRKELFSNILLAGGNTLFDVSSSGNV